LNIFFLKLLTLKIYSLYYKTCNIKFIFQALKLKKKYDMKELDKEQIKNTKLVIVVFIGYTKIHHIIF